MQWEKMNKGKEENKLTVKTKRLIRIQYLLETFVHGQKQL